MQYNLDKVRAETAKVASALSVCVKWTSVSGRREGAQGGLATQPANTADPVLYVLFSTLMPLKKTRILEQYNEAQITWTCVCMCNVALRVL